MSDEVIKIKEYTEILVSQAVNACSQAYLLELQTECQTRGPELAAAAAKIKEDRKKLINDSLEANGGRFSALREKNKSLQDQHQTLSSEEQAELNSYEKKLSQDLKIIKNAEDKLKNEATPFDKIYKIIFDLARQKQNDPKFDISKAFDEYKDTAEYKPEDEGKRITENDKLLTLFYLKDFAQNYGLHFAEAGQVIKDSKDVQYQESMVSMLKTANLYMIGKSETKNGQKVVGNSIFTETNNALIFMANTLFCSNKTKGNEIVTDTYNRIIKFCDKKASQMVLSNLDKEVIIEDSPYFNKENSKYAKHIDLLKAVKESVRFLSPKDKKSLADRELDKSKLSFGRSGSPQFSEMETAYKDFQKRLTDYINSSDDVQKKYLLQASIEKLDKKADAYLSFKGLQIQNKEIDTKQIRGKDGTVKVVPANSKTLQRMQFAAKIREDMSKQREVFADKKVSMGKSLL